MTLKMVGMVWLHLLGSMLATQTYKDIKKGQKYDSGKGGLSRMYSYGEVFREMAVMTCYFVKWGQTLHCSSKVSARGFTDVTQQAVTDTHPSWVTTPLYLIGQFKRRRLAIASFQNGLARKKQTQTLLSEIRSPKMLTEHRSQESESHSVWTG